MSAREASDGNRRRRTAESLESALFWLVLLTAALAARALLAIRAGLIEVDGAYYAGLGARIAQGDWRHGISTGWPPAFPMLIGAAAWLARAADDPVRLERCARAVSVLCGTLLLVPLYRLSRGLLPRPHARAVVLLAAFHPRLLAYSASALSEMMYTLFLAIALALLAATEGAVVPARTGTAGRRPPARWLSEGLAGASLGLSYLTRPEGILVAGAVWLSAWWSARGRTLAHRLRPALLVGLVLVVLPYVLLLHERLGAWSLGEKGGYNFWRVYRVEYARHYAAPEVLARRINESPERADFLVAEPVRLLGLVAREPGAVAAASLGRLVRIVFSTLPVTVYLPFALLALVAFLGPRTGPWWLPVTPLVFVPALYSFFSADRRFFVPLVPLALVACGQGLCVIDERWPGRRRPGALGPASRVLLVLFLGYSMGYATWVAMQQRPEMEHRAMGEWLRGEWAHRIADAQASPPVVVSRKPWVAFYSGGLIAQLPRSFPPDPAEWAPRLGPCLLVADERSARGDSPELLPLLDPRRAPAGWRVVHVIETPRRIVLYELGSLRRP
jgi:4-amino-4-deoxy-L-arabinose transferase-like glycosyltransferase